MFVQFSDSKETTIISVFGCPQDPETFPNQGEVTISDARYASYFAALPEWAQQSLPAPG